MKTLWKKFTIASYPLHFVKRRQNKRSIHQFTFNLELANHILPSYGHLSEEALKGLRKKYQEESQARTALCSLVTFTLYITAVWLISFMERDQRSFSLKYNLDNYLLSGNKGFSQACSISSSNNF